MPHFSKGQLYSNTILVVYPSAEAAPADLAAVSRSVSQAIRQQPNIIDVYSLDSPLGRASGQNSLLGPLLNSLTHTFYQGQARDGRAVLRFEILTDFMPFTPEAIASFEGLARLSEERTAASAKPGAAPRIMLSGPTSYIIGVKSVVGPDQRNVMTLSTIVIGVIVLVMVRDLALTLFMLLATWLTYGATITLSTWFFIHVMGLNGLDWKVRMILFVIVVAVGQDYNIFLVSRLLQNRRNPREAAREAIVRTGSVISSCGIIMAATLGSLWAGRLSLLEQLGFALGAGILIDTFFVRPLLIPAFFVVMHRRKADRPSQRPNASWRRRSLRRGIQAERPDRKCSDRPPCRSLLFPRSCLTSPERKARGSAHRANPLARARASRNKPLSLDHFLIRPLTPARSGRTPPWRGTRAGRGGCRCGGLDVAVLGPLPELAVVVGPGEQGLVLLRLVLEDAEALVPQLAPARAARPCRSRAAPTPARPRGRARRPRAASFGRSFARAAQHGLGAQAVRAVRVGQVAGGEDPLPAGPRGAACRRSRRPPGRSAACGPRRSCRTAVQEVARCSSACP